MTRAIISFDTEMSAGLYQRGVDMRANFESSILGRCRDGDFGIYFQMDMLERYGLKGVYFVDPMPALVYGPKIIDEIVQPIVRRGHEVQLHIHTEWLKFARFNPVGRLTGRNIGDFPLAAQKKLIALARDILVGAGAPRPTAFRAGNFGANDDTLRSLAALGFAFDSSFNGAIWGAVALISLDAANLGMRIHHAWPRYRSAGCATAPAAFALPAVRNVRKRRCATRWTMPPAGAIQFSAFSHSFELLSRDRRVQPPGDFCMEALCRAVADDLAGDQRRDCQPAGARPGRCASMCPRRDRFCTLRRVIEQGYGHLAHEVRYVRDVVA